MKFWSNCTWKSARVQAPFKTTSSKCIANCHHLNTCTCLGLLLCRYVGITFDEMYIREDLVFDKHQCRVVGFVNMADFGNQLQHLEDLQSDLVSHQTNLMSSCVCYTCFPFASSETSSNCEPCWLSWYKAFSAPSTFRWPIFSLRVQKPLICLICCGKASSTLRWMTSRLCF